MTMQKYNIIRIVLNLSGEAKPLLSIGVRAISANILSNLFFVAGEADFLIFFNYSKASSVSSIL
ncbi:hypothetical protein [Capnocytophaga granulosa]|uniref:hypothetical protein n=1 Tax=Capnocytophaga granulosa TaxID=45242 RepID=UPI0015589EBE|nr:hypothetical protein [Capnocytophaga granulosa]